MHVPRRGMVRTVRYFVLRVSEVCRVSKRFFGADPVLSLTFTSPYHPPSPSAPGCEHDPGRAMVGYLFEDDFPRH